MKASYYPGCALHGTARIRRVSQGRREALDVELVELPDWNCCGASSAHATDEALALNLAVRNLPLPERREWTSSFPARLATAVSRRRKKDPQGTEEGIAASGFSILWNSSFSQAFPSGCRSL